MDTAPKRPTFLEELVAHADHADKRLRSNLRSLQNVTHCGNDERFPIQRLSVVAAQAEMLLLGDAVRCVLCLLCNQVTVTFRPHWVHVLPGSRELSLSSGDGFGVDFML